MKTIPSGARTLDRGLTILDALAQAQRAMGVTELSAQLGLDKSTVHRLLTTLVQRGYARRDPRTRNYTLGVQALVLYDAFQEQIGLRNLCHGLLEELAELSGETSHLAVLAGMNIVFVDSVETQQMLAVLTVVGRSEPAHCTALGKAILAVLPNEQRDEMLRDAVFEAYTDRTPTTREALEADLQETAERGWAFDNEEFLLGVRCLSSAVHDHAGYPVAALGISGPASRLTIDRCNALGKQVSAIARRASTLLGYSH